MVTKIARENKDASVNELTEEEARQIFEEAAQRELGIPGEEFLRRWDAGEFKEGPERAEVVRVAILIPLVR